MGYVVCSANYSLSPKYKICDIMNDVLHAINKSQQEAEKYGGDSNKIILAGDSCGAHMSALATAFAKHNKHGFSNELFSKIKALVLFYGVFDFKTAWTSRFPNIKTYIESCMISESGTEKWFDELVEYSPLTYDVKCFPPCLIASGEVDKLHKSQSAVLSSELTRANIEHVDVFFDDKEYRAMHAFMAIDGIATNVEVLRKVEEFLAGNVK